jgi:hypothetical protein
LDAIFDCVVKEESNLCESLRIEPEEVTIAMVRLPPKLKSNPHLKKRCLKG